MPQVVATSAWVGVPGNGQATVTTPAGARAGDLAVLMVTWWIRTSQTMPFVNVTLAGGTVGDRVQVSASERSSGYRFGQRMIAYRMLDASPVSVAVSPLERWNPELYSQVAVARWVIVRGAARADEGPAGLWGMSAQSAPGAAALFGSLNGNSRPESVAVIGGQHADGPMVGWAEDAGGYIGAPTASPFVSSLFFYPALAPAQPTQLAPGVDAELSGLDPVVFRFQHKPGIDGGRQDAYRLQVRYGGAEYEWDSYTGALGTAEVVNAVAASEVEFPSGLLPNNVGAEWRVMTREAWDQQWSQWSPWSAFRTVTPPKVVVTAPTGAVHNRMSLLVEFVATIYTAEQTAYQVVVRDASGRVVHDSGPVTRWAATTRSYTVPVLEWVHGATYTVEVYVQQSGGLWSQAGTSTFTMTWDRPAAPSQLSVFDHAPGVQVVVRTTADVVRVWREDPAGVLEHVGPVELPVVAGQAVVHDPLAPFGRPVRYRAEVAGILDGERVWSAPTTSAPVISSDRGAYLMDDVDRSRWVRLFIVEDRPKTHTRQIGVTYGLGDTAAMVDRGPLTGMAGALKVRAHSSADRAALLDLLHTDGTLLLRWEPGVPMHGSTAGDYRDGGISRIAVSTPVDEARWAHVIETRDLTVEWVEQ